MTEVYIDSSSGAPPSLPPSLSPTHPPSLPPSLPTHPLSLSLPLPLSLPLTLPLSLPPLLPHLLPPCLSLSLSLSLPIHLQSLNPGIGSGQTALQLLIYGLINDRFCKPNHEHLWCFKPKHEYIFIRTRGRAPVGAAGARVGDADAQLHRTLGVARRRALRRCVRACVRACVRIISRSDGACVRACVLSLGAFTQLHECRISLDDTLHDR